MIDISDGLSTDLEHICKESKVGAEIEAAAVPVARLKVGNATGKKLLGFALNGGEDYELLFTAGQGKSIPRRIAGVAVTAIGVVTRSRKVILLEEGKRRELPPQGWEHFRKTKS
jgi:thiamine-monophosphate kinase